MIPTFALFFISFLMTALLAPKPKLENARAEDLDPENFPRATEDDPVPLLLGKALIKGPNTIWYGNFKTVPIIEKVKVSIFSSKKVTVGYKYYLSLDLGLCLGPCTLHDIIIDDVPVLAGRENPSEGILWHGFADLFIGTRSKVVDLQTDLGLTLDQIKAASMNVSHKGRINARYQGLAGTGPAIAVLRVSIEFLDADGNQINSIYQQKSGQGVIECEISGPVPSAARKIRFTNVFNPLMIIYTVNYEPPYSVASITGDIPMVIDWDIYEPELFGGNKQGGGWIGNFTYYPGNATQNPDAHVQLMVGDVVPGYNGVSHIVFQENLIGESPSLRSMSFLLSSYTNHLDLPGKGKIGDDINPAEALTEIILNKWRGLGRKYSAINVDSFTAAGTTLHAEGNGISVVVSSGQTGKEVITEILRQIDGMMYQDPESQEFILKLIRRDYNTSLLRTFTQTHIKSISSFARTTWADVYAQVKVSYSSREKDTSLTAIAQDMAIANMKDGELKTSSVSFPMCYDGELATELAARELSQLSVPVFKFTMELNRTAYDVKPGDVFKVTYPEYGLYSVVVRAQEIDAGELLNNRIVIQVVQDIFAVEESVLAAPAPSSWVDYERVPARIESTYVEEIPVYFNNLLDLGVQENEVYHVFVPKKPSPTSTLFSVFRGFPDGTLDMLDEDYMEGPVGVEYPLFGLPITDLLKNDGFETGELSTLVLSYDKFYGEIDIPDGTGMFLYCEKEWMTFSSAMETAENEITVYGVKRGVLGSEPLDHFAAGQDPYFFFKTGIVGTGESALPDDLTHVYAKVQNRNVNSVRDLGRDEYDLVSIDENMKRPVRPRNLEMDGNRIPDSIVYAGFATKTFTWVSSNKHSLELETDAAGTPIESEEYVVQVVVDGSIEDSFVESGFSKTIDLSVYDGVRGEVRVYARRIDNGMMSRNRAFITFLLGESLFLLSGDMTSGSDSLSLSGDMDEGSDRFKLSGGS